MSDAAFVAVVGLLGTVVTLMGGAIAYLFKRREGDIEKRVSEIREEYERRLADKDRQIDLLGGLLSHASTVLEGGIVVADRLFGKVKEKGDG